MVTPLLYVAIGFAFGAAMDAFFAHGVIAHLRDELAYHRKQLEVAQDRLVHAWRDDKAIIPPRPVVVEPPKPLPPELLEVVNEWESPETRAAAEAQLRNLYFEKQWGVQAILKHLQNQGL